VNLLDADKNMTMAPYKFITYLLTYLLYNKVHKTMSQF